MRTLVSVIIPAFNMADYIERTIISALNQSHRDIEIIVVDDGSEDETCDIVLKYAISDSRVRLIRQPNAGVAAARNKGIEACSGDFVAPLDADDLWHEEKIERQLRRFQRCSTKVALVYCSSVLIDGDDFILGWPERDETFNYEGDVLFPLIYRNFGCASVPLVRRKPLLSVGGYDATLRSRDAEGCEDKNLYIQLAEQWPFACSPEVLVGRRIRLNSMSYNLRSMHRSHSIVIREASRRNGLPRKIVRWAQARADKTFAGRSFRQRDYIATATGLLQFMLRDPVFFYACCLKSLLSGRMEWDIKSVQKRTAFQEIMTQQPILPKPSSQPSFKPLSRRIMETRRRYFAEVSSHSRRWEGRYNEL